jgi:hypothetical protein
MVAEKAGARLRAGAVTGQTGERTRIRP